MEAHGDFTESAESTAQSTARRLLLVTVGNYDYGFYGTSTWMDGQAEVKSTGVLFTSSYVRVHPGRSRWRQAWVARMTRRSVLRTDGYDDRRAR